MSEVDQNVSPLLRKHPRDLIHIAWDKIEETESFVRNLRDACRKPSPEWSALNDALSYIRENVLQDALLELRMEDLPEPSDDGYPTGNVSGQPIERVI